MEYNIILNDKANQQCNDKKWEKLHFAEFARVEVIELQMPISD